MSECRSYTRLRERGRGKWGCTVEGQMSAVQACAWASCVKKERNKQAAFPLVVCLAVRECVTTLCSASVSSHLLLASFFPRQQGCVHICLSECVHFSPFSCVHVLFQPLKLFGASPRFFFCIISHCVPVCGCSVLSPFVYICVSAYGSTWCFSALNAAWHFLFLCVCTYSGVHSVCKVFN